MSLRNALSKYAVYRRALLSYIGLIAITVIAVSGVLFLSFRRQTVEDIARGATATLEQTAHAIDLVADQVRTVGNALLERREIVTMLYARTTNRYDEYQAALTLDGIKNIYPFIRFIAIYNHATGRYVNRAGLTAGDEAEFIEEQLHASSPSFISTRLRTVTFPWDLEGESLPVVSFVLNPNSRFLSPPQSFIVINVDVGYIERLVAAMSVAVDSDVVVATSDGRIIASPTGHAFLSEYPIAGTGTGADTERRSGSYERSSDRGRRLVSYARTSDFDWLVLTDRGIREIASGTTTLAWVTVGVAAAILFAGAAVALVVTNAIYSPLGTLVERIGSAETRGVAERMTAPSHIDEFEVVARAYDRFVARIGILEDAVDSELPILRRSYVHSLLMGLQPELPDRPELAERVVESLAGDRFIVVVCALDGFRSLHASSSPRVVASTQIAVSRTLRDTLLAGERGVVLSAEENEVVALVASDTTRSATSVILRLREVQVTLHRLLSVSVSCAIGAPVESIDRIHESLQSAREHLAYRYFEGRAALISGEDVAGQRDRFVGYPTALSQRLVEHLRLKRVGNVGGLLEEFRSLVARASYPNAIALVSQLAFDLLSAFESALEPRPDAMKEARDLVQGVRSAEYLGEAMERLRTLCDLLEETVLVAGDKKAALARAALEYLETHFADTGLSLESAADALGVSGGYLGRVFKQHQGVFFSEYLNTVRVEHARELLLHSELSASEIGARVGMSNSTYFYTLFKKLEGVTPVQFREGRQRA